MKNNRTMQEMNEQYKDCPERTTVREIDGCRYIVHSHFVGKKDLDEVISKLAFQAAMRDEHITV